MKHPKLSPDDLRGVIQGLIRYRYPITIVVLAAIFVCVFLIQTYTAHFQTSDLKVCQTGPKIAVLWKGKADAFRVEVTKGDKDYEKKVVNSNYTEITMDEADIDYTIRVRSQGAPFYILWKEKSLHTKKIPQRVYLKAQKIEGFKGTKAKVKAVAQSALSYSADESAKVSVGEAGEVKLLEPGTAEVRVSAEENALYKAAEAQATLLIYPTKLGTPKLKTENVSKGKAKVHWSEIPYAQKYVISVYDPFHGKYKKLKTVDKTSAEVPRDDVSYKVTASARILGKTITGKASKPVETRAASHDAKTYSSLHFLGTLDQSKVELVANVKGPKGTTAPQSFSYTGDGYLVAFADKPAKKTGLGEFTKDGRTVRLRRVKMGHANGSTYNPDNGKIYTLKRHKEIKSRECKVFHFSDFSSGGTFKLPKRVSGISYDVSNGKYYLASGTKVYVANSRFQIEKTIHKIKKRKYTQDTGAGNGVALACSWDGGNKSYIDLYRTEDGGYLGSYKVPLGEIESATIVDKHIVILVNAGYNGHDIIVKTKKKIPFL